MLHLTLDDSGHCIPLSTGAVFELCLPESPTTGVRWILPETDELDLISDSYSQAQTNGIGASGMRALQFRTTSTGLVKFHMIRAQAWSSENTQDASFDLVLDVRQTSN